MTERANVMVCEKIISDETGALTIEWVVLTAGVIALGIAVYGAFKNRNGKFICLFYCLCSK